jgi:hypothetical protein
MALGIIIVFFLILATIFFLNTPNKENFISGPSSQKPIIWLYWENKPGKSMPVYLNLCLDTIKFHCERDFNIILLNEKSVYDYLPGLRTDLEHLMIAQKTDYIRAKLLYTYGGIWMDVDTVVMRNLKPIIDKLKDYDFVGFGCTGMYCKNGFPNPSNQLLAARKGSILFKHVLDNLDRKLNHKTANYNYFDLGKKVIWEELSKLRKKNYNYYHFDSSFDGSRLKNGRWMRPHYYFNSDNKLLDEDKLHVIFLSNHDISSGLINRDIYDPFLKLSRNELLKQEYWLSKMFRKSLISSN